MDRTGIHLLNEETGGQMNEIMDLALIGALLLVSLSVIYCADAILQEMAKQRLLMEIQLGGNDGRHDSYTQGLRPVREGNDTKSDTELHPA